MAVRTQRHSKGRVMAQETDKLLEHEYDGIHEYDNPLPRWWVWLFYGSIVFTVIHLPYYTMGFGPSSGQMYEEEVNLAMSETGAQGTTPAPTGGSAAPGGATASGGTTAPAPPAESLAGNPEAIAAGAATFSTNCLPCHGDKGQGLIGPNLTDNHWLHGNTYPDIVKVITEGVPAKGMISWKAVLNPRKIQEVAAFVASLKGTSPPNPKPPQGQEYPD